MICVEMTGDDERKERMSIRGDYSYATEGQWKKVEDWSSERYRVKNKEG